MRGFTQYLRVSAALSALAMLSSTMVDALIACGDCPSGKVCIVEDKAVIPTGQNSFTIKACNFDAAKASDYTLEFALQKPLACDSKGDLLPKPTSLTAVDGCSAASCVVTVKLEAPIDWAIAMRNGDAPNVLQAKFTGDSGDNSLVQVGTGTETASALMVGGYGDSADKATVCTTDFGVKATRLSKLEACNVVTLCRGKPTGTDCPTPLSKLLIDDVECTGENCTGTITIKEPLPCDAASSDTNALIASVTVGNSAGSNYVSIAALSAAPAATISSVTGATVGSKELYVKSDASCLKNSLVVNVSSLATTGTVPSDGTIIVALTSALESSLSGKSLDISVSQCDVPSATFSVKVAETGDDVDPENANADDSDDDGSTGGDVVGGPTGTTSTQKSDAKAGLTGGMYIAIGVGALAFFGFVFECVYHHRRHHKERAGHSQAHSSGGAHSAV